MLGLYHPLYCWLLRCRDKSLNPSIGRIEKRPEIAPDALHKAITVLFHALGAIGVEVRVVFDILRHRASSTYAGSVYVSATIVCLEPKQGRVRANKGPHTHTGFDCLRGVVMSQKHAKNFH